VKTNIQFWSHIAKFFSELKMFQKKVVEKIETHILRSVFFLESPADYGTLLKNNVEPHKPQMTI